MYVHVGQALIRAVRDVTGDLRTLTASAWASVYQWLADEMITGARESGHDL
jgi:hemoglobin-like flavoprotein